MKNIIKLEKTKISEIIKNLEKKRVVIIKNFYSKKLCNQILDYLKNIGSTSLPSYHQIEIGSPNFYRVNFEDNRSYVKGFFHQFNFFPWNQDQLNLFKTLEDGFILKNIINKLDKRKFFSPKDNSDCTIRLSFQFYPIHKGYLNTHSDPVSYHQKYLFMLSMSTIGKDFKNGGLYIIKNGKKILLDSYAHAGDLIIIKADTPHGVDIIDINKIYKPLSFKGRWMVIFSTNKLPNNNKIKNSKLFKK